MKFNDTLTWSKYASRPESIGTKSGTVKIVGPAQGWQEHFKHDGEIMAVNWSVLLVEPDVFVSKHTEMFQRVEKDCLKITGDTWTIPSVESYRLSNVLFSGVFAFLVAKLLGYDRILIFGMPADYSVPALGDGGNNEAQRPGWERYRSLFENTTAFGGNLPKWFPELKYD